MKKTYTAGYYFSADSNGGQTPIGAVSCFDFNNYKEEKITPEKTDLIYNSAGFKATVHRLESGVEDVLIQSVAYENTNEKTAFLETAATFFVEDISGGVLERPTDFNIYTCKNYWQGEGQWRSQHIDELGIYKTSDHICFSHFLLSSQGSWSTGEHYPLMIIEDTVNGESWFFELEGGFQWLFELAVKNGSFCVMGTQAAILNGDFTKTLQKGESFTTPRGFFGYAAGGFEAAVRKLTDVKRRLSLRKPSGSGAPLVFNDYMNCLWAMPSAEKLIPLIDAAAAVGCEIFCMDDGWLDFKGDWNINDKLYGKYGLKGIIDYIRSRGMQAGIWLEIESAAIGSEFAANAENLLSRNGIPIGTGCKMVDFRKEETKKHIRNVIDMLYSMGIRYIKNDYNMSTVIGIDGESSPCENLIAHSNAFYSFINGVYRDYPDLIIENCGSGAMRSDNGTLGHFDLQSTSDQEIYTRYPSIAAGSAACMPPEKAGIWAYPYPMLYNDRLKPADAVFNGEYIKEFSDGEQTAFNMVTSLCGVMYLSGRIEYADALNRRLIADGAALFKKHRAYMAEAYPFWPLGLKGLNDRTWNALGFLCKKSNIAMLAVWKIGAAENECEIDLSKRLRKGFEISDCYHADGMQYEFDKNALKIRLKSEKRYSAIWFAIDIKR